jgi:DNA-binding NarL/FixJ family response regulator
MIRTLIVEENPVARLGTRSLLGRHADALEIDEAGSRMDMMTKLCARYYELVIIEPKMSGGTATSLLRQLRENSPWSDVLVFTALDELTFGVGAIRDGAKGYLMKTCTRDELATAVKRVGRGQVYLSEALAAEFSIGLRKYDTRTQPHESFSKREFEVFAMAVGGMTPAESAYVLQMSVDTLGVLRRSVMDKLRASTLNDMVDYAAMRRLSGECRAICSALWTRRFSPDYVDRPATRTSMFFV